MGNQVGKVRGILVRVGLMVIACSAQYAFAQSSLPNVKILATGGTIAGAGVSSTQTVGYTAAVTAVEKLIQNVPEMAKIANVSGEQISQVASQDVSNEILLKLAKRINVLLSQSDVDGVVVTHGTNTLEETSFFLNLVVKSDKPVVLVGSMRPGTAISADGPMNLLQAVTVAGSKEAHGKGALVVMNDWIIGARDVAKTDTLTNDTFKSPIFGLMGFVVSGKPIFYRGAIRKHTAATEFDISNVSELPRVDIVYGYQSDSGVAIDAMVKAGAKGIVTAGTGTAAVSKLMIPSVKEATKNGVLIVRSPRNSLGVLTRNMEMSDDDLGTVSGDTLTPFKARVLLTVALTKTRDPKEIQRIFDTY